MKMLQTMRENKLSGRSRLAAALAATLLVSFLVMHTSRAAFTSSVESPQSFGAGTVELVDTVALSFDVLAGGLWPGGSSAGCVELVYVGSIDADVDFHVEGVSGPLAPHLDVELDVAEPGDGCVEVDGGAGTSTVMATEPLASEPAVETGWSPSPEQGETGDDLARTYVVSVTMDPEAGDELQG